MKNQIHHKNVLFLTTVIFFILSYFELRHTVAKSHPKDIPKVDLQIFISHSTPSTSSRTYGFNVLKKIFPNAIVITPTDIRDHNPKIDSDCKKAIRCLFTSSHLLLPASVKKDLLHHAIHDKFDSMVYNLGPNILNANIFVIRSSDVESFITDYEFSASVTRGPIFGNAIDDL